MRNGLRALQRITDEKKIFTILNHIQKYQELLR